MNGVTHDGTRVRVLTAADLPFALALRDQAGWNQTREDWRRVLALAPRGAFVAECGPDGASAGTAVALVHGGTTGWIALVLVDERFRRRGVATALVERCLEHIADAGAVRALLDATAAGREVYARLGFGDRRRLARFAADGQPRALEPGRTERMRPDDAGDVARLDARAFGADRGPLLGLLADEVPEACRVVRRAGRIEGFVMARRGVAADQVGPCVAARADDAAALLTDARAALGARRVVVDVPLDNDWALRVVIDAGFAAAREFVRMAGPGSAPADAPDEQHVLAICGPEYG